MFNNCFNLDSPNMNNSIFYNFFVNYYKILLNLLKTLLKLEHHITGFSSLLCLSVCVYFAVKKDIKITMKNKI